MKHRTVNTRAEVSQGERARLLAKIVQYVRLSFLEIGLRATVPPCPDSGPTSYHYSSNRLRRVRGLLRPVSVPSSPSSQDRRTA